MILNKEHTDFEDKLKNCIGQNLSEVEYLEVDYQAVPAKAQYKTRFDEIDSVDFSIILYTDKGKVEFWDGQFFQYGVGFAYNEASEIATGQKWNVSQSNLWKKFIGKKITGVKISWEKVSINNDVTGRSDTIIYPQTLRILFSNGKTIIIGAAGFLNEDDKEVSGMHDSLIVTDNELLARQVKLIS